MLKVYVIASYQSAPQVRAIHDRLRMAGIEPTSSWAEEACGAEDLASLTKEQCRAIWKRNDSDMRIADAVMVLADTPCREGFMEAARAYHWGGQRIVWVGRPTLTARAWVDNCVTVATVDEGIAALLDAAPAAEGGE